MYAEERRRQIASLTSVNGRVSVTELSERFNVTAETIRRDLTQLDRNGAVHRVHGGAVATKYFQTHEFTVDDRERTRPEAKNSIAHAALSLLPHRPAGIFLDAGTTTAALAQAIAETGNDHGWSIVTNSLPNAMTLAANGSFEIQLLGGTVRAITEAVVGETALRALGLMRADVAFIGTNALSIDHGLSTADPQEAAVKRAMVSNAQKVVVMCDSTKLGRDFLVSFAGIEEIDVVITDSAASPTFIDNLQAHDIEVIVTERDSAV
ncbi:DeoR/GlpR family DNA-binding transcription regulator [Corynebacterium ulceribovis]|uniref:DeoR/GlpR family DNA-binding transcription regulator n=1 Tax=Corynebacterium ulceribovis TaxID=487732 RepID=UPI00037AD91E|nr:DeoR/GlpR family DNA-binding transcription regulator [Corynebacterium ulceribovis]